MDAMVNHGFNIVKYQLRGQGVHTNLQNRIWVSRTPDIVFDVKELVLMV